MDLNFTPEEEAFRAEVQAFLKAKLPERIANKVKAGQRLSLVKTQRSSAVAAKSGKKMTQKSTQAKGKSVKRSTKKATIKPTRTASKKKARKN